MTIYATAAPSILRFFNYAVLNCGRDSAMVEVRLSRLWSRLVLKELRHLEAEFSDSARISKGQGYRGFLKGWSWLKCHVEGLPQKHITYNPEDQMNTLAQL
jgi:hypothetical protein